MIREAIDSDIDAILEMCCHFWECTQFNEPFDVEQARLMVELSKEHGLLTVLDDNGINGFVAGVKSPLLACGDVFGGTELAWWIEPEFRKGRKGIDLMLYIEELARNQGVKYWTMVSMESSSPETANRIYERLGYSKSETSFTKVL